MEAHMVEAVRLQDAEDAAPGSGIGWRITGERKDGAFQCTAEKNGTAVHEDLIILGADAAHTEAELMFIPVFVIIRLQLNGELIQLVMEFIPQLRIITHGILQGDKAILC